MCLHSPVQRGTRAICHRWGQELAIFVAPLVLQVAEVNVVFSLSQCHLTYYKSVQKRKIVVCETGGKCSI